MSRRPTEARYGSGQVVLASRWMIAEVLGRNPETVLRRCVPVACDVRSRALLYDVDEAEQTLGKLRARRRSGQQHQPVGENLD